MLFANRAAQVLYMITGNGGDPLVPGTTLSFRISSTTNAVILVLGDTEATGYSVTAPRAGTTSYTLENDGDLESCATKASSQVDGIFGRSATAPRTATVVSP